MGKFVIAPHFRLQEWVAEEPYTRESFDDAQRWIAEHKIFEEGTMGSGRYDDSVVSLAA